MMWGYESGWNGFLMSFVMIFWIALLIVLAWTAIHWFDRRSNGTISRNPIMPISGPSSLELLRQRYVWGEIDTAAFEQMREHLEASFAHETKIQTP